MPRYEGGTKTPVPVPALDPSDALDYSLEFNPSADPWLEAGESVAEIDVSVFDSDGETSTNVGVGDGATLVTTAAGNVTPPAPAISGGSLVIVWLYGDGCAAGQFYIVTVMARTSSGRVKSKSMRVPIAET